MGKCTCGKTKDPNGNCDGSHNDKSDGTYSYSARHRMHEIKNKEVKDYGQRNDTKESL